METWRDIIGYEGRYEVSDHGNVRRKGGDLMTLVPDPTTDRLRVHLAAPRKFALVHRLVAEAFIGPAVGRLVLHDNGNHRHNHLSNLKYGTHKDNADDRDRHGTTSRGERCNLSKLTEADVRRVRERLANGESCSSIAGSLNVSPETIKSIKYNRSWRHVT